MVRVGVRVGRWVSPYVCKQYSILARNVKITCDLIYMYTDDVFGSYMYKYYLVGKTRVAY